MIARHVRCGVAPTAECIFGETDKSSKKVLSYSKTHQIKEMSKQFIVENHSIESCTVLESSLLHVKRGDGSRNTYSLADHDDHGSFFVDYSGRLWHCWYGHDRANMTRTICTLEDKKDVFRRINVMNSEEEDKIVGGFDLDDDESRTLSHTIRTCQPDVKCWVRSYKYEPNGDTTVRLYLSGIELALEFVLTADDVIKC